MQDNGLNKKQSKEPKSPQDTNIFHIYIVVLIIEIFLIIILAIINVVVGHSVSQKSISNKQGDYGVSGKPEGSASDKSEDQISDELESSTPNELAESSDSTACQHRTKDEIYNLVSSLTKDEAINIIKNNHENQCTPQGLIPEKYELKPYELAHEILYSYDDVSEVTGIAQDSVMGLSTESADDFQIDESTDYYTIVSVDASKIACGESNGYYGTISCYRGISFNKKYLNRYKKVEDSTQSTETVFSDLSPEFVELVLKIVMASDTWHSESLYDYYFEDNGDNFTLTGIYFGVGVDLTASNMSVFNIPYAINIYEMKLILDKNTGESFWEKHESELGGEAATTTIKTFSLSNEEMTELQFLWSE